MLLIDDEVAVNDFLDEFKRRFSNFCNKAPVILTFKITPSSCYLKDLEKGIVHKFDFNHLENVKQNIKKIKDWLIENIYPKMIEETFIEKNLSTEEIEKLIDSGLDEEEAIMKKNIQITETVWVIEKLIIKRDELFVKNLKNNKMYRYKMNIPSTLFLKKIRSGDMTKKEVFNYFYAKSTLIAEMKEEITK